MTSPATGYSLVDALEANKKKECKKIISRAIKGGTPLFNDGEKEACYIIWSEAIISLTSSLRVQEDTNMLKRALSVATNQDMSARPWTLRLALETFSWIHFSSNSISVDIHTATTNGYIEKVAVLSELSALVNELKGGYIPLHVAAMKGFTEIGRILLEKGAHANCPSGDREMTALHYACEVGNLEIVKLLVEFGAALEVPCHSWTALHFAVENGHLEVANYLLEEGAISSPIANCQIGAEMKSMSPLDIAIHRNDRPLMATLLYYPSITAYRFITLSKLKLNQLDLSEFPCGITNLTGLTKLDISFNPISELPSCIGSMTRLIELEAAHMMLQEFPIGLCSLASLSRLILAGNQIYDIPFEISTMTRLERLDLSHNLLETLPADLGQLTQLKKLSLEGNTLYALPPHIASKGTSKLLEYLRKITENHSNWKKMKLMFVGRENVGKTSLLRALESIIKTGLGLRQKSTPTLTKRSPRKKVKDQMISTDGIHVSELSVDDTVSFSAWDFAGQEVFYQTHQFFLTSRSIYLVIFNITNIQDSSRIKYWLRQIRATSSDRPPILLVGTHRDHEMCTKKYLTSTREQLERNYPARLWNIIGIHFVSTRNEKGIRTLYKTLKNIASKHKTITQKVPETFVMLDRLLTQEKERSQVITWREYCTFTQHCSITKESIPVVTSFLHDVGTLMHFSYRGTGLDDLVILDPQWIADIMASLVSFKQQWVKSGILTPNLLPQVWKQYPPHLYPSLLSLLTKFEVAVELKDAQKLPYYVIPSLLPIDPPHTMQTSWEKNPNEGEFEFGRIYQLTFHFDFSKVIARIFSLGLVVCCYWKNGMIFISDSERAFVQWKVETCRLIIAVRTKKKFFEEGDLSFLRLLVEMVESILESFYPGIHGGIQRLVPCSHCATNDDVLLGPYFFAYEECVSAVTNGESFVFCRGVPTRPVNICYLAPDIAFKDFAIIDPDDIEITTQVGSGAFGIVYKGKYEDIEVAIKELICATEGGSLEEELFKFKEFQREVGIMSGLKHKNLVELYGITIKPHLRMVMEWCPESDLYHFLTSSLPLDWELRLRICIDMAKGMRYLQGVTPPIIHRDLRSPNIFLMSTNPAAFVVAKVADFGLSLRVEHRVGGFLPTWRWLAPEVIDASNTYYDQTADIYSFAMVMWEVVTRSVPFSEYDGKVREIQMKEKIISEHLRPTVPADCPPILASLIQDCWKSDPKARPNFDVSVSVLVSLQKEMFGLRAKAGKRPNNSVLQMKSSHHPLHQELNVNRHSMAPVLQVEFIQSLEVPPERMSGIYAMILVGTRIWSAHSDGYIIIWDTMLLTMVRFFQAHDSRIESMLLVEGCVWTCAKCVKVWDGKSFDLLATMEEKEDCLIKVLTWVSISPDESYVWSGDVSGTISVWDTSTLAMSKSIKLEEPVNSIAHVKEYVWIGLYRTLVVLRCSTLEFVDSFNVNIAKDICISDGRVWVANSDKIGIWNCETLRFERELQGHTSKVVCIIEAANLVWSASFDTSILLWSRGKYKCIQELKGVHLDTITCLVEAGHGVVWSADRRGTLSVWGVKEDEFTKNTDKQIVRGHRRLRSKSCK